MTRNPEVPDESPRVTEGVARDAERARYKREAFLTYYEEKRRGIVHSQDWHAHMKGIRDDLLMYEYRLLGKTHDGYPTAQGRLYVARDTPVIEVNEDDFGTKFLTLPRPEEDATT